MNHGNKVEIMGRGTCGTPLLATEDREDHGSGDLTRLQKSKANNGREQQRTEFYGENLKREL